MADTSSQKKVILTPATASISCTGTLELKAVLSPPDTNIRVSIDGGGQNAHGNNTATLQYTPKSGDCGKADVEFTASAPGYEDGKAKVNVVKTEITNFIKRIPIYRSQRENGSERTGRFSFTTKPDGIKVTLQIDTLSGKGAAKFKDGTEFKKSIEVTTNGETTVLIAGIENSNVKENLDIKIKVGANLLSHTQFSVRTWVEGFEAILTRKDPGGLFWTYRWRSESGTVKDRHLGDLDNNMYFGEVVNYANALPAPPYIKAYLPKSNQTAAIVTANVGAINDKNGYPGYLDQQPPYFAKPYKEDTNTATQKLGFWDIIWDAGAPPTDVKPREDKMKALNDPPYSIVREIAKDPWTFTIRKDGKDSSIIIALP